MTISWPKLNSLRSSVEQSDLRRNYIGGSDANVILSGDSDKVFDLWREKRGDKSADDLSDKLPVALGSWTEAFNRQWYERLTGRRVERCGEIVRCQLHEWRRCALDGFVEEAGAVWEAKHTSAFARPEEVLDRFMPQLQHNMAVVGAARAILSVIFGNHKYEIFEVESDWLYQRELLDAEEGFWGCVCNGRAPAICPSPPPPKVVGVREVCFERNNAWAAAAADWLQHRDG